MKKEILTPEEYEFIKWIRSMTPEERKELIEYLEDLTKADVIQKCPMCGQAHIMTVDAAKMMKLEQRQGLIQDIFPELDKYEREFIKTGYCPKCQEMLFGAEPYEGEKIKKYR